MKQNILHDSDIRASLINHLLHNYSDDPNTRILQEFGLCNGDVRIDIAVVNGELIGFEIKSDSDTLERLPYQQTVYSQVFNKVIIVVGIPHTMKVLNLIPKWWGIWQTSYQAGEVVFEVIRKPLKNPNIDRLALAQCLWREEALNVLRDNGLSEGIEKAKRSIIREKLACSFPEQALSQMVCAHLKARVDWNIVLTPK